MTQLVLVLDNLRSAANVGSLLRTCDAAGILRVVACGTTPYPSEFSGDRDPVVVRSNNRQIAKTALGAEQTVAVEYMSDIAAAIALLRREGRTIYALEQDNRSVNILQHSTELPAALVVGNEVDGITPQILKLVDSIIEIPQVGTKESLNVSVAAAIAIYHMLFPRA